MHRRKKLSEQVVVITGASSGIGLVTARMAAERGARVVLAARNEHDLRAAADAITERGGRAIAVPTDVAVREQVRALAERAVEEYGRFDTWINGAAASMYGRLWDLPIEDARRQMDVSFWGAVHGSLVALDHFVARGCEGGIINVTSVAADRAIPLQGIYCAAKHALHAFSDTLRMEIEEADMPISVTEIKPGSIDTPFFEKARNFLDREAQPVPPVYAPEVVARAILSCCESPQRSVAVGGMSKLISMADVVAPRASDLFLASRGSEMQLSDVPLEPDRRDSLYAPLETDGGERGHIWKGRAKESSVYTWAASNKRWVGGVLLAALALPIAATLIGRARTPGRGTEGAMRVGATESSETGVEELPIWPT